MSCREHGTTHYSKLSDRPSDVALQNYNAGVFDLYLFNEYLIVKDGTHNCFRMHFL